MKLKIYTILALLILSLTIIPAITFQNTYPDNHLFSVGDTIEIKSTITDPDNISQANITITYPNGTTQTLTLTNQTSNLYNTSFTTPELAGEYNISISANDTLGNWNTTQTSFVNDITDPTQISGLRAWYDAGDNSTLYTDEDCTTPVSSAEQNIRCWQDKSSYSANATNVSGKGTPTYSSDIFNGRSVVNFSKADSDTLRHTLGSSYTSAFTIFIVMQSKDDSPETYESFFSNGDEANTNHFQIDYVDTQNSFRYGASQKYYFEPFSNEIKLYAVTHSGTEVKLYNEGEEISTNSTTEGRLFEHYRINQNRAGNKHHDSYIGEIVLYDKVLTDCELEQVDIFLGDKYGRDFFGLRDNYGYGAPHNNDINGIGEFSSKCSATREFDHALSTILRIDNPTSLDLNDSLTFAHDNGAIALITDVPSGYNNRINRTWRLDEDNNIGNVDIKFDISDLDLLTDELEFALLTDTDTTFSNAATTTSATLSGNTVTFSGINPTHGEYITLAIKDTTNPQINTTSPTNNSQYNTSETIEISANISDASLIHTQYINITLPNQTTQKYTLTNQTNNKYNISYTIPKQIGQFKITFFANDTYSNENTNVLYFTTKFQNPLSIADLQRWYDASDNTTLFTDSSCTTQVSADQDSVNCWLDKSDSKINATILSGHNPAKFESKTAELINGKTKLRFNHTSSTVYETSLDIRATTLEDVSIFTVYRPKTTTKNSGGSGQALWGNDDGAWDRFFYSLFDYSAGLGTDGVDDGLISLGGASSGLSINGAGIVNDLFLLTAIYDGNVTGGVNTGPTNASQIYFDGNLQTVFTDESDDTAAKTQMYIGWDGDNSQYDGDLAEIIIYGRVMNACEIETINNYLGEKYGKDFVGINDNYGLPAPYNNDVNGVGMMPSDCTPAPLISSATSDILTISEPSSVVVNDTLTFGHNNGGLNENKDAINSSYIRLNQTWRADIDGDSDGVGTVTLTFDLSLNLTLLEYTTFVLLNDSDGDFSNANIINNSGTKSGNKITFTNVNLQNSDYFTIGFYDNLNPKIIPTSPENNSEHQSSTTIEISANITDNYEIHTAKINLTYPNSTTTTITLTNQTNNKYNTSITPTALGDYTITFIANDTTGNINSTEKLTITIYKNPRISFENPTPTNNSIQNQNFIPINISSSKNKGQDHYTFVNFDNSLLMWLRMDETNSSGHPTDSSGNGNNGTLVGNAKINSTGRFGDVLHLDGNGDYVNLPASNSLIENTGAWTISLWLNTKSIASADLGNRILTIRNASGLSATAFALGGSNKLQFFYRDTSGTGTTQNITTISTNTWYHYAVTYNGTTSKIYINGQLNHTNSESIVGASSDTARIGASPTASAQFFNGSLDEILILNHELTSQEILSLYNATENQYSTNTSALSDGIHTFTGYSVGIHGLKNQTETRTVTIDTIAPNVTALIPTSETEFNTSTTIEIATNTTDNIGIDTVQGNITYPNGSITTLTLTNTNGNKYNTSFTIPQLYGTFQIKIISTDTAGNINSTETTTFLTREKPLIEFINPTPQNFSTQNKNNIHINISSTTLEEQHYTFLNHNNSLVLWLRMDDTNSSGDPTDISPYQNNGTLIGNPTINSTGKFGDSIHLDGNGDYIEIPNSQSIQLGTSDFTYSLWFNSKEIPTSNRQMLSKRNDNGNYEVQLQPGGSIRTYIGDAAGGGFPTITTPFNITTNRWYHVVITRGSGNLSMYINGTLINQTASTHNVTTFSNLYIGADGKSQDEHFNGSIDEVLIFNRSLSSSEVSSLYNATSTQYQNNFTNLNEGTYKFTGYAVSTNGLKNQTETRTITIDLTPPQIINLNTTPQNSYNLTAQTTISLNITDENEIDSYSLNITLPNSTVLQKSLTKHGNLYNTTFQALGLIGNYTIKAIANDTAGNTNSTETINFEIQNHIPTQTNIEINSGNDLTLSSGTTKQIIGTTRITDLNGHTHISNLTGYFYLTETGESETENKSRMYKTTCIINEIISTTQKDYNCTFNISHYATATDSSANKSGTTWTFKTVPLDNQNTGNNATTTIEINSLLSFNINPSVIDFGDLTLGENTSNSNKIINITNLGNTPFDITLSGNDLSCDIGGVEVEFIEYGKNPFSYGVGIDMLESTIELDLDVKIGSEGDETPKKQTYYGIGIPGTSVKGNCSGSIVLSAVSDVGGD